MTKPVDLIVANVMHEAVDAKVQIDGVLQQLSAVMPSAKAQIDAQYKFGDEIARRLLNRVSQEANMATVFKALAAVGAPATPDLINDGMQAVKDRQSP